MFFARLSLRLAALLLALAAGAYFVAVITSAQTIAGRRFQPDTSRALRSRAARADADVLTRQGGYVPQRQGKPVLSKRPRRQSFGAVDAPIRRGQPALPALRKIDSLAQIDALINTRIRPGTPLSRVLHTAQLSATSSAGTNEQFTDADGDLVADERATFDTSGGSFDIAVGRSGTRYEVFTAIDDRGTATTSDDLSIGILVNAFDTNGDFTRDSSQSFDLRRDFNLPSATSVVAGTSRAGREFVIVSSSGYYNYDDPSDPDNEPTAGVILLVRDTATGGFDNSRSRSLVQAGSQQLNNANALALLPTSDLLIADFDSNELRIIRDTDNDLIPDTLDPTPYYSYQFSDDAPLDIAANSRGVVFSHSAGNNTVMLALYDTNNNGFADTEEVVVEGLSIDNNLIFHGLTVDREGTVYVIEDATGASDRIEDGGNGGTPLVDAFPDPALNGFLRDGALYVTADNPTAQFLSGLAFGVDTLLGPVARLSLVNSASLRAPATRDGLASITGAGLTLGRSGTSQADANARGIAVAIEGRLVPIHSFNDTQINVFIPNETGAGIRSIVVYVSGDVIAANDQTIADANPGLFTVSQNGMGAAVALLASGMRYTPGPFPARFNNGPSVISLFGTGWRNSLPITVTIGGRAATVEYAGASGGFPGFDQINVRLPDSVNGTVPIAVTTAGGAVSRSDVTIRIN
ncbi:hypothetical protein BH18ACI2_BH18ACI2_04000 [soil metagenome]